jgi:hypothetical protein
MCYVCKALIIYLLFSHRYYGPGTCGATVEASKIIFLTAPDGPEYTIVDCSAEQGSFEVRHFNVAQGGTLRMTGLSLVSGGNDATEQGGCIQVSGGSTVTLVNSILTGCRAQSGGAIHVSEQSFVSIAGSSIVKDNSAMQTGGCLQVEQSTVTITGRTLLLNCKAMQGGGLSSTGSSIIVRDFVRFENCRATSYGGGIYASSSKLSIAGQAGFYKCASGIHGGAMHISDLSALVIFGLSILTQNQALQNGGGIFLDSRSSVSITVSIQTICQTNNPYL